MADLYANYAALSAVEVEGVDYTRTSVRPAAASWASIAIHGGAIEAGSGEVARAVAADRMAYYEFAGIKPANNVDLHITASNFDEPQCLALVAAADRILSFHGYTGTIGVAETAIGGLDGRLRDLVSAALTTAGFTVVTTPSELAGTDPANVCNKGRLRAGVQLEMSNAQRAAFFPGGDLSRAMRDSGQRTPAFAAYVAAVQSAVILALTYDQQLSRVRLNTIAPGLADTFNRTVVNDWSNAESGQAWLPVGTATAFQVNGGVGKHVMSAVNTSRWSLAAVNAGDFDIAATVATDALAAGGSQFVALAGRSSDDGATCYLARLDLTTAAAINLTVRKRVGGTETLIGGTFATGLTHVAGTRYTVRLQGIGSQLRAKAWLASGSPPAGWQITETDTAVAGPGRLGVRSILSSANTNTLPVTASWDNITTYGTAVVERSTDGVRWSAARGGLSLDGQANSVLRLDDYEFADSAPNRYRVRVVEPASGATLWTESDQITPTLTSHWLKSIGRPWLNMPVRLGPRRDRRYAARSTVLDIVNRTDPVVVTDLRASAAFDLPVRTSDATEAQRLQYLLAGGDILLLHAPAGSKYRTCYVTVGDVGEGILGASAVEHWLLPCQTSAAPEADVVGATTTCDTILAHFATCTAVQAAFATCAAVTEYVANPSDVIVP